MPEVARVYPLKRQQPERRPPGPLPSRPQPPGPQLPEPLWREALGRRLRALRAERGETLAETAERAGISPQYLSEVERGRKEPSSEMIAAMAGALDTTLIDLTTTIAEDLRQVRALRAPRAAATPDVLALAA
jgi:DNA-binding XRE family transcriptional regulator